MKRRINTRFLMIVTLSVVGVGVIGFVVKRVFFKQRPEQYIRMATVDEREGRYEDAARNYERAFILSNPKDAELLVREGDVLGILTQSDPESVGRDVRAYARALEVDPRCKAALQKMVQAYTDQLEFFPGRQELYGRLQNYARRLHDVDPSDKKAKAKVSTSTIMSWLNGVATDKKEIDATLEQLAKLTDEDSGNADVPYVLALGKLQQAGDAQRMNLPRERERLRNESAAVIEQAVKNQPDSPEMHLKAAMIYASMSRSGKAYANDREWAERFKKELARSRELVQPTDAKYVELQATACTLLMQLGDADSQERAKALLDQLLKENPDEPSLRLNYARLMRGSYEGRQKALEWLGKPVDRSKMRSLRVYLLADYEMQMLVDATGLRMEQYATEKDESKKPQWMAQIEKDVAKVANRLGDGQAPTLTLKGRLLQLKGQNLDAIQMLERSRALLKQQKRPTDYELLYALARGYVQQGETGQARRLLLDITNALESFVPARMMLAQMFLQENLLDDPNNATSPLTANGQLGVLEALAPTDAEVIRLRLVYYILKDMPEQAKGMLTRLPEERVPDILLKATLSLKLGEGVDTTRLLEKGLKMDPTNPDVVSSLAGMYLNANHRDKAIEVVNSALALKPDDAVLKMLVTRVTRVSTTNPTLKELEIVRKEMAEQIKDPADRELYYYNQAREQGKSEEALRHLENAEKFKPDNVAILDLRYKNAMLRKDWNEALKYADKLGRQNADKAGGAIYKFRATLAKGDLPDALTQASDLTKKMPEFSISWLCMGQVLQAMGQYNQAITRGYLQALEKRTENAMALKGIVDCYYAMNQPDDALRYIGQGRGLLPDNPQFIDLEIQHSMNYGDGKAAAAVREEALKQSPEDPANWENAALAWLRVIRMTGEQNPTFLAQAARHLQVDLMDKAIAKWPDESSFYAHKADVAIAMRNMAVGEAALKALSQREAWKNKPQPYRMLGDLYAQFGKLDLAEKSLAEAVTRAPKEAPLRQRLAQVQAEANKTDEALKTLEPVTSDTGVQKQQVQILTSAGRAADAEKLVLGLLEKNPSSPELLRMLMTVYTDTGNYDKALTAAQRMLEVNPNDVAALFSRGLIRMQGDKPDLEGAMQDLKQVKDKNPSNTDARYWLAMAYRQSRDWNRAIVEMDEALRQAPANRKLRLKLIELCSSANPPQWNEVESQLRQARSQIQLRDDPTWSMVETDMWLERGRPDKASIAVQDALQLAPQEPQVQQKDLSVKLQNKQYDELIKATDQMVKKGTDTWWLRMSRGVALQRQKKKDEALGEFEKAISTSVAQESDAVTTQIVQTMAREVGADDAIKQLGAKAQTENKWRLLAAYLYQAQDDIPRALQIVEQVLADDKNLTSAQRMAALKLGSGLYMLKKPEPNYEKAIQLLRRLLSTNQDDLTSLNNMACLLVDLVNPPQPEEGLKYAERAYRVARQRSQIQPMITDTYGWAMVNCPDRFEEGFKVLRDVVSRNPFVDAHYHLGWAYLKKSLPEQASEQLALAAGLMERNKKGNPSYDVGLERKINDARKKAQQMLDAKKTEVRAP